MPELSKQTGWPRLVLTCQRLVPHSTFQLPSAITSNSVLQRQSDQDIVFTTAVSGCFNHNILAAQMLASVCLCTLLLAFQCTFKPMPNTHKSNSFLRKTEKLDTWICISCVFMVKFHNLPLLLPTCPKSHPESFAKPWKLLELCNNSILSKMLPSRC